MFDLLPFFMACVLFILCNFGAGVFGTQTHIYFTLGFEVFSDTCDDFEVNLEK